MREYPHASAELARPLVHEFNNFLNMLVLQIALLERKYPTDKDQLATIKGLAKNITLLTQQWQNWRIVPDPRHRVDLAAILKKARVDANWPECPLIFSEEPFYVRSDADLLGCLAFLLIATLYQHQMCEAEVPTPRLIAAHHAGRTVLTVESVPGTLTTENLFVLDGNQPNSLAWGTIRSLAERLEIAMTLTPPNLTLVWKHEP